MSDVDRQQLEQAWERAFGEPFEKGLERVKTLLRRFGIMDRFEREGPGGKAAFDHTRTSLSDSDFARVAVLAMVGAVSLGEEFPQVSKLLGGGPPPPPPRVPPGLPAPRLHYFDMDKAPSDTKLEMAIHQGYVPATCLLAGAIVLDEVNKGRNPCWGCEGPRAKCGGRPKA